MSKLDRAFARLRSGLLLLLLVVLPLAFWTPFLDCFPLAKSLVVGVAGLVLGLDVITRPHAWLFGSLLMIDLALFGLWPRADLPAPPFDRMWPEVWLTVGLVAAFETARAAGIGGRKAAGALVATAAGMAVYGILQGIGVEPGHWMSPFAKGVASTIGNPDLFGGFLLLPFGLALAEAMERRSPFRAGVVGLLGGALLLTEARAAWLGAAAGAVWLLRGRGWRRSALVGGAATGLAAAWLVASPAALGRVASGSALTERLWTWRVAGAVLRDRPLLGAGLARFRTVFLAGQTRMRDRGFETYHYTEYAHLEPLHLAVELGVLGLGVWLWWFAELVARWRASPARDRDPALWRGLGAGGLAVLVNALFSFPFHVPATIVPLAVLWGAASGPDPRPGEFVLPLRWSLRPPARLVLLGVVCASFGPSFGLALRNAWLRTGEGLALAGRPVDALADFAKAGRIFGTDVRLPWYAGAARRAAGDPDGSRADLERAIALEPGFFELRHELGMTEKAAGRLPEAEAAYRAALRINPGFAHSWNNLGNLLGGEGKLREAEAAQRRALALLPDDRDLRQNLVVTLLRERRVAEAKRVYAGGAP